MHMTKTIRSADSCLFRHAASMQLRAPVRARQTPTSRTVKLLPKVQLFKFEVGPHQLVQASQFRSQFVLGQATAPPNQSFERMGLCSADPTVPVRKFHMPFSHAVVMIRPGQSITVFDHRGKWWQRLLDLDQHKLATVFRRCGDHGDCLASPGDSQPGHGLQNHGMGFNTFIFPLSRRHALPMNGQSAHSAGIMKQNGLVSSPFRVRKLDLKCQ